MATPDPTPTATAPDATPAPAAEASGTPPPESSDPAKPEPGATPVAPTAAPTAEATPAPVTDAPTKTTEPAVTAAESTPAGTTAEKPAPTPAPATAKESEKKEEESEEPQSELTKKFTEAEWKAMKELRSSIPEILAESYPDKADAKTTPIFLWGVPVDPNGGPKDARLSVILVKFLRARNNNVKEAKEMLIATLRWREEFNIDAVMKEKFPEDVFGKLGLNYGHDLQGRPVTYNLYGANKDLKAVFGDVQRFLRWRVQLMESSIALLDFTTIDQVVQVHDYEGVSMRSRDQNSKNAASEATSIFQSHYPEFLARKFFINVPSLLTWIFWLFKPLISAQTLAKMTVVGSGAHTIGKELLPVVGADELPKRYGGKAEGF